jgi:hypothetical protein
MENPLETLQFDLEEWDKCSIVTDSSHQSSSPHRISSLSSIIDCLSCDLLSDDNYEENGPFTFFYLNNGLLLPVNDLGTLSVTKT